jgi:predicted phosphodiesterase
MIKKLHKIIVISDIHLGEEKSLFKDRNIIRDFKEKLSREGKIEEFIILGDLFDLSLVSFRNVYEHAKEFFSEVSKIKNIENIVFVPGNHDHHIWTLILEEEEITKKINNGSDISEPLKRVDREYDNTFLNGLLPGRKIHVTYPNLLREIGGTLYFLHHGHLLDRIFTPAGIILKPESLQELEAFNSSWIEGIWYHLGQAERLGQMVNKGYKEFLAAKTFIDGFLEKFDIHGKTVAARMRGFKTEKLKSEIEEYLTSCIDWYKEKPYKLYPPISFIFGHTHRKSSGEEIEIKGEKVNIYNTGAWHGDLDLAAYIVIDEKDGVQLKTI